VTRYRQQHQLMMPILGTCGHTGYKYKRMAKLITKCLIGSLAVKAICNKISTKLRIGKTHQSNSISKN
jgi:hypothetical protein